ncbi:NAD(+) diphosphatase [Labrys monachus]|uniref:NAD(+) diphosphatase n=1 Tax=Labrys monachus TaxID=217067 RepID=A0ABU0FDT7_9HYPH|nr:NAD(+) diphosphatase [Labrys monachus]MDQ0392283.1 NAD+ diphosphatase [Labrys monachus]
MTVHSLFDRSAAIGFCVNPLDRVSDRREDADFIARSLEDPASRFFAFAGDVPVLRKHGGGYEAAFTRADIETFRDGRQTVLLGLQPDGGAVFARSFDKALAEEIAGREDIEAIDLRSTAQRGLVPDEVLGELSCAKETLDWHNRHRFCANCGHATEAVSGGWRRDCGQCGAQHFPRVDPVVIMLAVDGDRCLMGRQARFPEKMYSALAGFLEPGETVEDAVRREIREEAGIACSHVRYFASQPWPFPSSLMVGCFARAIGDGITIDMKELEDARWFTRAEVVQMLAETHPAGLLAPKPVAIAHHLLKEFAEKGGEVVP